MINAERVQTIGLRSGLSLWICGAYGKVIRFPCPPTTDDAVRDEAPPILATAN